MLTITELPGKKGNKKAIVGVVVGTILMAMVLVRYFVTRRKRNQ
jgi:hypothetical protein